jgi:hypothetical protein
MGWLIRKEPLDGFEDLIPTDEFLESVKDSFIRDYDGFGFWSDGKYQCEPVVFGKSMAKKSKKYKYVAWYNK